MKKDIGYPARMKKAGRPVIGKPVLVHIPAETLERVDAISNKGSRSQFIRDAVQAELDRRDAGADSGSLMAALVARKIARTRSGSSE